jgi:hypothetical protein
MSTTSSAGAHTHTFTSIPGPMGPVGPAGKPGAGLIDVRNYGALGDDTTDDTAAIMAALTAGAVFFSPGTYLSAPLALPPGAVLQGVNGQAFYNSTATVPNPKTLSRLRLKAGSTRPLLSPDDSGSVLATSVRILDLSLDCNGLPQPAMNLPDQAASISRTWRMDRVYICNVGGTSGYAAYIGNQNTGCTMRDCMIFNGTSGSPAGHHGVGWYGSDGLMNNCFVGMFGGVGVYVLGGASDETFTMRGGGTFSNQSGIVAGAAGVVIDGVSIDRNYNDGIYTGAGPVIISGCTFHSNSRAATNTWSNITVDADNAQVAVIGCRAAPLDGEAAGRLPKYMIDTRGHAGVIVNEFGNFIEPGVVFGTGWKG